VEHGNTTWAKSLALVDRYFHTLFVYHLLEGAQIRNAPVVKALDRLYKLGNDLREQQLQTPLEIALLKGLQTVIRPLGGNVILDYESTDRLCIDFAVPSLNVAVLLARTPLLDLDSGAARQPGTKQLHHRLLYRTHWRVVTLLEGELAPHLPANGGSSKAISQFIRRKLGETVLPALQVKAEPTGETNFLKQAVIRELDVILRHSRQQLTDNTAEKWGAWLKTTAQRWMGEGRQYLSIDWSHNEISDAGAMHVLAAATSCGMKVQRLRFSNNPKVSDAVVVGVEDLLDKDALQELDLAGTGLTQAGSAALLDKFLQLAEEDKLPLRNWESGKFCPALVCLDEAVIPDWLRAKVDAGLRLVVLDQKPADGGEFAKTAKLEATQMVLCLPGAAAAANGNPVPDISAAELKQVMRALESGPYCAVLPSGVPPAAAAPSADAPAAAPGAGPLPAAAPETISDVFDSFAEDEWDEATKAAAEFLRQ